VGAPGVEGIPRREYGSARMVGTPGISASRAGDLESIRIPRNLRACRPSGEQPDRPWSGLPFPVPPRSRSILAPGFSCPDSPKTDPPATSVVPKQGCSGYGRPPGTPLMPGAGATPRGLAPAASEALPPPWRTPELSISSTTSCKVGRPMESGAERRTPKRPCGPRMGCDPGQ